MSELLLKNVRVVTHDQDEPMNADIAIADGRFVQVGPGLSRRGCRRRVDGRGLLAFPGVVDAHQHWGIYNPLDEDAGPRAGPARRAA